MWKRPVCPLVSPGFRNNPLNSVDPDGHAHSECTTGQDQQTTCYVVGDKNGELANNGTLRWNSKSREWESPSEHTYDDDEKIRFVANGVSELTRFHSLWGIVEHALPVAMPAYFMARANLATPFITLNLTNLFKSAAESLPDLTGLSKEAAREALEKQGFKPRGTTPGGYEKWYHPDGSRVQIRPNGEVVRTGPTMNGYRPRIGPGGTRTDSHNTGEILK